MQAQAGNGEIQSYLSMDLFQVVNKGNSNDAWETQLTDLNAKLNVTLQVKDEMKNQQETAQQEVVLQEAAQQETTTAQQETHHRPQP